jgi:hypothetical protein
MTFVAQTYAGENAAPDGEPLDLASLAAVRAGALRLLGEHRDATRVEVRLAGRLMLTFLARKTAAEDLD